MRTVLFSILVPLFVGAFALGALILSRDVFYVVDSYRYRLVVNFAVDGKPLSFSGVVQETIRRPPCIWLEQTCVRVSIKGDAIPVTFPNGKTAFVLLQVVDEHQGATVGLSPSSALPKTSPSGKMDEWMNRDFPVSPKLLPTIVYFSNLKDPYSLIIVDPQDITEVGGAGTFYENATVSVTDEPVTRGIERILPWVSSFKSDLDIKKVDFFQYTRMKNLVSYLRRDDL